jgi:MoxR-like ATPase
MGGSTFGNRACVARIAPLFDSLHSMTDPTLDEAPFAAARQLHDQVLLPLKRAFVGKDEIVDLLGVCLVARENLFLLGPPGTAKSALVRELARRIDGRVFDYLLTRFTEPNELFGPFDIRRLREGDLVTNTEGMLPEADFVFLDELLNANSAILNSLLMALNERVFRRGRETRPLPALMFVGASNRLPEDESLRALFDRFLLRASCDNVGDDRLSELLAAGWRLDAGREPAEATVSVDRLRALQRRVDAISLDAVMPRYAEAIIGLRRAGIAVSDRRAVKLQRLVAASALLCGRTVAETTDLWVLRYIWDTEEQQTIVRDLVDRLLRDAVEAVPESGSRAHPRALERAAFNAENLAASLRELSAQAAAAIQAGDEPCRLRLRESAGSLAARCQWIENDLQRSDLQRLIDQVWTQLETGR